MDVALEADDITSYIFLAFFCMRVHTASQSRRIQGRSQGGQCWSYVSGLRCLLDFLRVFSSVHLRCCFGFSVLVSCRYRCPIAAPSGHHGGRFEPTNFDVQKPMAYLYSTQHELAYGPNHWSLPPYRSTTTYKLSMLTDRVQLCSSCRE